LNPFFNSIVFAHIFFEFLCLRITIPISCYNVNHKNKKSLAVSDGNGQAIISDQGDLLPVGAGKILYIPPHTTHNIRNSGTEPLTYIYCVAPVGNYETQNK
jgi:mannose-6-phosphate isomerase-like protein (cupin superfamily)